MISSMKVAVRSQFAAVPLWLWLIQILTVSVFQMSFFVLMVDYAGRGSVALEYVALGNALQSVTFVTVYAVCSIPGTEKHAGTLSPVMSTPSRLFTVFVGKAMFQIFAGIITVVISLLFANQVFGVSFGNADLVSVAAVILVTTFAMTGFGLMLGSIGLYARSSSVLASLVLYLGLVLCGVNFPVSSLPSPLQVVSYSLPMTYGVDALREAVAGAGLLSIGGELAIAAFIGSVMIALSYWMFRWFEKLARERGTTDMF